MNNGGIINLAASKISDCTVSVSGTFMEFHLEFQKSVNPSVNQISGIIFTCYVAHPVANVCKSFIFDFPNFTEIPLNRSTHISRKTTPNSAIVFQFIHIQLNRALYLITSQQSIPYSPSSLEYDHTIL